jgi:hypothetical protein
MLHWFAEDIFDFYVARGKNYHELTNPIVVFLVPSGKYRNTDILICRNVKVSSPACIRLINGQEVRHSVMFSGVSKSFKSSTGEYLKTGHNHIFAHTSPLVIQNHFSFP